MTAPVPHPPPAPRSTGAVRPARTRRATVGPDRRRLRLDVRLDRRAEALHRLLALLHRKGVEVASLHYERHDQGDLAAADVLVDPARVEHLVDCIDREVLVLTVDSRWS